MLHNNDHTLFWLLVQTAVKTNSTTRTLFKLMSPFKRYFVLILYWYCLYSLVIIINNYYKILFLYVRAYGRCDFQNGLTNIDSILYGNFGCLTGWRFLVGTQSIYMGRADHSGINIIILFYQYIDLGKREHDLDTRTRGWLRGVNGKGRTLKTRQLANHLTWRGLGGGIKRF